MKPIYLLFGDESGYIGNNRYRSIGVISGRDYDIKELNNKLQEALDNNNVSELKFVKINGHSKYTKAAKEFIKLAIEYIKTLKIKIYAITWDTYDSRHNVNGRKDIENLKRMYYHLLCVCIKHWNKEGITWGFYPDEFCGIDWNEIITFIENRSLTKNRDNYNSLWDTNVTLEFPEFSNIKDLVSENYPIIQLCDLFAGMVRFSHSKSNELLKWREQTHDGMTLFEEDKTLFTNGVDTKCKVINYFYDLSKKYRLGVSLNKMKHLHTFSPKNNFFFWKYDPQGEYDKAPSG